MAVLQFPEWPRTFGKFLLSTGTTAYYYDRENDRFTKIEHNESWLPARSILVSQKGTRYLATFGKGLKVIQPDLKELRSEVITLPFIDVDNAKYVLFMKIITKLMDRMLS